MDIFYKLTPSDFAFLYNDCKRCFYRKVKLGIYPPRSPMASIFNTIDEAMKSAINSADFTESLPEMPKIEPLDGFADVYLTSQAFKAPEHDFGLYIFGKLDNLSKLSEGEGYAIIDYKATHPRPDHIDLYKPQLHAYRFCLEHPGIDNRGVASPKFTPITRLGLLCFDASKFEIKKSKNYAALFGDLKWLEVPIDDDWFMDYLGEISDLIAGDLPDCGDGCQYCRYEKALKDSV